MTDPTRYLNDLKAQLERVGIRGARRERIVTEFADHLSCAPDAELGDPAALATQFADELGTSFARTAAFHAFVALALAGILVVVAPSRYCRSMQVASAPLTRWRSWSRPWPRRWRSSLAGSACSALFSCAGAARSPGRRPPCSRGGRASGWPLAR